MPRGALIISLDFELYWGVRDKISLNNYKKNILGARFVIPSLLRLFDQYGINATWATIGFLFFSTKDDLIKGLPANHPFYSNRKLSPYDDIDNIGKNENEDPFHYAPSLIRLIASYPNQEIASHTFSHYHCLEIGQNKDTFKDDLRAAIKVAKNYNLTIKTIVFPKNQVNNQYLPLCKEMGIRAFRGNETSWLYKARSEKNESLIRRLLRLADAYFNISGHNAYSLSGISCALPVDIPSSRFLRSYSNKFKFLEPFRLRRIISDLDYAAKNGLIYHLWWHPHNFGENPEKNISFLKKILDYYSVLRKDYGMESLNMGEFTERLIEENKQNNIESKNKIIILGGQKESTNIIYNSLKKDFLISKVIIEVPVSKVKFLKNRIKKLGFLRVFGQILFGLIIVPFLRITSKKRIIEIKKDLNLDDFPIDKEKIVYVDSVNSEETIVTLKEMNPSIVVVNGTRIISEKILDSIPAKFINMHSGVTPLYRGVHGAYWALVKNDKKGCGVTVHFVDYSIDGGKIIEQELIIPTEKDNFITYPFLQLGKGIPSLKKALKNIIKNQIHYKNPPAGKSKIWTHPTFLEYVWNKFRYGIK